MPPDLPSQRPGMIDTFHQEFGNQDSGEIAQYYKIGNSERHRRVARGRVTELKALRKYPVYFFKSDTTGEKDFEEFYTDRETLDMKRFDALGVIKNVAEFDQIKLDTFEQQISLFRDRGSWSRGELIDLFNYIIPEFNHKETGKFLDGRM